MIIGPTIATWYQNELALSTELIDGFIDTVEAQAATLIEQFKKGVQTHEVVYDEDYPPAAIEEYRGLTSETWPLEWLFEEYFPSLQRRSALLTVWGYFEHELDKLCLLYKAERHFSLSLSDIYGDGIDRSTKYLEKVAGLNVHRSSAEWGQIQTIRKLRNKIAHQDGRLITKSGAEDSDLISYVDRSTYLRKHGQEVLLREGFLKFVVETFNGYFGMIGDSIKNHNSA